MAHTENPAKVFLRRYISMTRRVEALDRAINQAMERAFSVSITLKEVRVISTPAEHDPMASSICTAVDACEILYAEKAKAEAALQEIVCAINSLADERQKTVLTMRYISGYSFPEIAEKMHFSEPAIFVCHGRALLEINRWLERRADNADGTAKVSC